MHTPIPAWEEAPQDVSKDPRGPPVSGVAWDATRLRGPWSRARSRERSSRASRGPPWTDGQVAHTPRGVRRAAAAHSRDTFTGESHVYSLLANQPQHAKKSAEHKPLPHGLM